jgi:hypothetical protein
VHVRCGVEADDECDWGVVVCVFVCSTVGMECVVGVWERCGVMVDEW